MSDLVRTALPIALLLLLFCIEVPVAFALSIAGMFGIYLFTDLTAASSNLAAIPFTRASTYTLTVVPMFMLVGVLVSRSAILEGAFEVAQRMVKRLPGGMGVATVMAATFLGGITGSSVADAATVGRIAIGEMAKRGYDMAYAAAIVAAAATVAILLPTSIALAVFGVVTGVSVGKLLLGGLIPALCTSLAYVCVIVFLGTRRAEFGRGAGADFIAPQLGWREFFSVLTGLLLFGVIIGGLYTGIFTPTEAGAVAATSALILASAFVVLVAPSGKLGSLRDLLGEGLKEAGSFTAMIFALGATPITPRPLLPSAAIVPAQCVPWP